MEGYCDNHMLLATDIATIKSDIKYIIEHICNHIEEGEGRGGFRDRLVQVESGVEVLKKEISSLKKAKWMTACVSGVIGGLVAQLLPETVQFLVKTLFR